MTNTKLTIMGISVNSFQEGISIAEYFANTDLVPKDYRGKPANIMVAWQKGIELGLKPLQSLSTIAVVNGRATIWGDGLIALVKNSSKEEWTHETLTGNGDSMIATCETKRSHQEQTIIQSFSVLDAKKAGLWGNNTWAKYPKRMLQMRARGLCLRDAYPDVLNGLEIAEEMNDFNFQQKTEAKNAPKSLKQLGLSSIEENGFLVVKGNTYGKSELIKQLGFEYRENSWRKELAIGEAVIDTNIIEDEVEKTKSPKKSNSPAKKLMVHLMERGIEQDRIKEFVEDVLSTNSKDIETIKLVLSDKEKLNQMIEIFLSEPRREKVF